MKANLFITALALMLSVTLCPLRAQSKNKVTVREDKVDHFSSIRMESVGEIVFTQSDHCSLRIEGPEESMQKITVEVKNQTLIIGYKEKSNNVKKVKYYLSAPLLSLVELTGVGSFNCNEPLNMGDLKIAMEGVGNINIDDLNCKKLEVAFEGVGKVNIHVKCQELIAKAEGVGHMTLSGEAGTARISKEGIGGVNTRKLKVGK